MDLNDFKSVIMNMFMPDVDMAARRYAHETFHSLSNDPNGSSLSIALRVLQAPNQLQSQIDSFVNHACLSILTMQLKLNFRKFSNEQKEIFKQTLLLRLRFASTTNISRLEQESTVRCIVELAKLTWPQAWPDFTDRLEEFSKIEPYGLERSLAVLIRLQQDTNTIPVEIENYKRKKDLSLGLALYAEKLFDLCEKCLGRSKTQDQILATLHCLTEAVEWVPAETIIVKADTLVEFVVSFLTRNLTNTHCMSAATRLLHTLACRNEKEVIRALLSKNCQEVTIELAKLSSEQASVNEDSYNYLKNICAFLCCIGHHFCTNSQFVEIQNNLTAYLALPLDSFLIYDSLLIRDQISTLLATVINNRDFCNLEIIKTYACDVIMPKSIEFYSKITYGSPNCIDKEERESPNFTFGQIDFDDDLEEFQRTAAKCHQNYARIVSFVILQCNSMKPYQIFEQFVKSSFISSNAFADGCQKFAKALFPLYAKQSLEMKSQVLPMLQTIMSGLFDFLPMIEHATRLDHMFSLLNSLIVVLPDSPADYFDRYLQLLRALIDLPESVNQSFTQVKRHVLAQLTRMSSDKSYDQLITKSVHAKLTAFVVDVADLPNLAPLHRTSLLGASMALTMKSGDFDAIYSHLSSLLQPVIAYFEREDIKIALSSPEYFIDYYGYKQEHDVETNVQRRKELRFNLRTVAELADKTQVKSDAMRDQVANGEAVDPLYRVLSPGQTTILEALLAFQRTLCNLHNPEKCAGMHSSFGGAGAFSTIHSSEMASLVDDSDASNQDENPKDSPQNIALQCFIQYWQDCNTVVGIMIGRFYPYLNAYGAISNTVYTYWIEPINEHIFDRRLVFMIRRTWKLVLHAAVKCDKIETLAPALAKFTDYLRLHIQNRRKLIDQLTDLDKVSKINVVLFEAVLSVQYEYTTILMALIGPREKAQSVLRGSNGQSDEEIELNSLMLPMMITKVFNSTALKLLLSNEKVMVRSLYEYVFDAITQSNLRTYQMYSELITALIDFLMKQQMFDIAVSLNVIEKLILSASAMSNDEEDCNRAITLFAIAYYASQLCYADAQVDELLLQVPGVTQTSLQTFKNNAVDSQHRYQHKSAKTAAKQMLRQFLSQNQQLPRLRIRKIDADEDDLPPLIRPVKEKQQHIFDTEEHGICTLFQ